MKFDSRVDLLHKAVCEPTSLSLNRDTSTQSRTNARADMEHDARANLAVGDFAVCTSARPPSIYLIGIQTTSASEHD